LQNELANALDQAQAAGVHVIVVSRNAEPDNGLDSGLEAVWLQQDSGDPWQSTNLEATVSVTKCSRCIVIGDFSTPDVLRCVLGALARGYDTYFLSDDDPDVGTWPIWSAAARLIQAGAIPLSRGHFFVEIGVEG